MSQKFYSEFTLVKKITERVINGKTLIRKETIGEVKILKVEEGGFMTADVRKGEKEITAAFESGEKLEVTGTE